MIAKSNTNSLPRCFFIYNYNLIKGKTKPIMKLNFQLTQYLRMKKKTNFKKLNLPDP
jgi:hypothetical protein